MKSVRRKRWLVSTMALLFALSMVATTTGCGEVEEDNQSVGDGDGGTGDGGTGDGGTGDGGTGDGGTGDGGTGDGGTGDGGTGDDLWGNPEDDPFFQYIGDDSVQCFTGNANRQAGVYSLSSTGGAGDLIAACDDDWGCAADRSTCATPNLNPGATRICENNLVNGRTFGSFIWKPDLAGNNQRWPNLFECPTNTPICDPDGSLNCVTSVIDVDSPFAQYSCAGADEIGNPTGLDTDCRCGINQVVAAGLPQCQRPRVVFDNQVHRFGEGPRIGGDGRLRGGFVEADDRELIIAGDWSNATGKHGYIWAIHMDTGDRRIISGSFVDPSAGFVLTTVGTGINFNEPYNIKKGPDGAYYVADNMLVGKVRVIRVDPATGDRTLVWDSNNLEDFGWCPHNNPSDSMQASPQEDIYVRSFTMDDDGNFYFANLAGGRGSGVAILKVSPDGQTCSDVTRSGASGSNLYVGNETGGGFAVVQGNYAALSIRGDSLFIVNQLTNQLIEVDLATGTRYLRSSASNAFVYGTGPTGRDGIPNWHTMPDPTDDNYYWVVGDEGKTLMVRVNLTNGNRHPISPELNHPKWERFVHGPIFVGNLGAGGMWFDPENPDVVYFAHDRMSIVKAELSTKNNRILSL